MKGYLQQAIENAQQALAYIDPNAKLLRIRDMDKYREAQIEMFNKYSVGFSPEELRVQTDAETGKYPELYCECEMFLDISYGEDGDEELYYPELCMSFQRKYNSESKTYAVIMDVVGQASKAVNYGRRTPYTVQSIMDLIPVEESKERLARIVELQAPMAIAAHEDLMLNKDMFMVQVQ